MLRVKDPARLKAFGFEKSVNDKYAFAKVVETFKDKKILMESIIAVDHDGNITVDFSNVVADELFDLYAANLVERVPEKADSRKEC